MKTNQYGEMIFDEHDLFNLIMRGHDVMQMKCTVDSTVDAQQIAAITETAELANAWTHPTDINLSVEDWDKIQQQNWHMPEKYKQLDIAEHILNLCGTEAQLQRCGHELLMYQERGLFDLLRYLTYLVDTMKQNNVIWGVGRGSSVASYVLYLLGVHRIDSMYYELDPAEFLR